MRGTNASTPWMTPQRLTPIAHSQSLWLTDSSPPHRATPALLHTTWTPPNSAKVRAARVSTSARRLTSVRTARPRRPARPTPVTVSAMPAPSRSATTTFAPPRAKSRASARPIPLAPPVTTAVRSFRLVRGTAPSVAPAMQRVKCVRGSPGVFSVRDGLSIADDGRAFALRHPARARSRGGHVRGRGDDRDHGRRAGERDRAQRRRADQTGRGGAGDRRGDGSGQRGARGRGRAGTAALPVPDPGRRAPPHDRVHRDPERSAPRLFPGHVTG